MQQGTRFHWQMHELAFSTHVHNDIPQTTRNAEVSSLQNDQLMYSKEKSRTISALIEKQGQIF